MKLLVLNNLSSGYRDGAIYDFARAFGHADDEVTIRCVDAGSSFASTLQDATDFDAVVAAGGDGTVASVCYLLRDSGVPILPYPAGTANLLAGNLVSPNEPHALAKIVRSGERLAFDLGEVEAPEGRFGFMMIAGCGYDAKIMSDAASYKSKLGPAAYYKAAVDNPNPQVSHITLTIDGEEHEHDGLGVLLVNFSKLQFDISVTEQNLPNDGLLDVIVLRTSTAWDLLPIMLGAAIDHSGRVIKEADALVTYRGREIEVVADPPLPIQYDGEPVPASTPLSARVLPGAANLIVSDEGYEEFAPHAAR